MRQTAGIIFILGLCIGSFLNVCIYRLPLGLSVWQPSRSFCPHCRTTLGWLDLIPLVSYLWLRGRCRSCGASISRRYPLVELATGLFYIWAYLVYGLTWNLVLSFIFIAFLLVIALIDYDHQVILDAHVLALAVCGSFTLLLPPLFAPLWGGTAVDHVLGAGLGGGVILAIALATGGMGLGDATLMTAVGWWVGLTGILVVLMLSFLLGGAIGLLLLASGLKKRKDAVPFGPFIAVAALMTWFYGSLLLDWYLQFTGLG